jgi:hypothetical protein
VPSQESLFPILDVSLEEDSFLLILLLLDCLSLTFFDLFGSFLTERKNRKGGGQLTLTVPTMFGWSIQKYGTSPASVKVYSNVACGAIIGESNCPLGVGPTPELTVCGCASLFVHVTVVPTLT